MTHYPDELASQPTLWLEALRRALDCGTSWSTGQAVAVYRGFGERAADAPGLRPNSRTYRTRSVMQPPER